MLWQVSRVLVRGEPGLLEFWRGAGRMLARPDVQAAWLDRLLCAGHSHKHMHRSFVLYMSRAQAVRPALATGAHPPRLVIMCVLALLANGLPPGCPGFEHIRAWREGLRLADGLKSCRTIWMCVLSLFLFLTFTGDMNATNAVHCRTTTNTCRRVGNRGCTYKWAAMLSGLQQRRRRDLTRDLTVGVEGDRLGCSQPGLRNSFQTSLILPGLHGAQ